MLKLIYKSLFFFLLNICFQNYLFSETIDIALRLTTLVNTKKAVGDEIKYTITIYNQGDIALTNIGIIDYLPANTLLSSTNPNGWVPGAGNLTASKTITDIINPGDSAKTDIYIVIQSGANGSVKNTAETVSIQDFNYINRSLDEIDSTPDGFNTEINVKDDVINEQAKINVGDDEDDHDVAFITVSPDVYGYESVKLTTDFNNDGLVTVGDIVTYTITYVNYANGASSFQITNLLPSSVRRKGTITASSINVTGLSLNSSYTGAGVNNLLNTGVTLGVNGKLVINIPVEIRGAGSGQTLSNQASATGTGISGAVLTDAIDNNTCVPPPNVDVPSGSISQSCTSGLDPVFFSVSIGSPDVRAFKSIKLTKDSDGNGVPSVGDTLTYTINLYNVGTANVNNVQISDVLNIGLTRSGAGSSSMSYSNGSIATFNSSFDGITNINLLGAGSMLEADTGFIRINFPVKVLVDGGGQTIGNLANVTGTEILSTPTDAVDNSFSGDCAPPTWISVPTGSITQTCSIASNDSTFVTILMGTPVVQNYKTVRWFPASTNSTGLPAVNDTLLYTIACFNTGTANIQNFQIIDTLPIGLQRIGVSNLSATSGSNALFNTNYPTSSYNVLVPNNQNKPILLKANGYLYVNIRVLVTAAASGLVLSNQAYITGSSFTTQQTDTKDYNSAPPILVDPVRPELRTNVLNSYIQNNQTAEYDPTLITISTLLPVDLVTFKVEKVNEESLLTWTVENENIWGYEVEKSKDGINFFNIGFQSTQNLGAMNYYHFTDKYPYANGNYYRLKIVEKSSKFSFSKVIYLNFNDLKSADLIVYPNPVVDNQINIFVDNISNGNYNLNIIDGIGKVVYNNLLEVNDNRLNENIGFSKEFHSGFYFIYLKNENGNSFVKRILVNNE